MFKKIDFTAFVAWAAAFKAGRRNEKISLGLAFCKDFDVTDIDVAFAESAVEAETLIATRHVAF